MNSETPVLSEPVMEELTRLIESDEFRASKRCQDFLRFVIVETLEGRADGLKERTIGVGLLGRPTDYDTNANASVRVRANEVRRRLRQYYSDPAHFAQIRIDLPSGSYVPEFQPIAVQTPQPPEPPPPRSSRRRLLGLAALVPASIAGGFAVRAYFHPSASEFDRFWGPTRTSGRPLLVCMDYVPVHRIRRPFGPEDTVRGNEITAVTNELVGAGGIHAISSLATMLTRMGVEMDIKIGAEASFGDLKHSPVLVMGCYNNRWSSLMYDGQRFGFSRNDSFMSVEERKPPHRKWSATPPKTVYGIVSRVYNSTTGGLMIGIAGISHLGTRGVAEFATNPKLMQNALSQAPAGWENRNLQIVLQLPLINDAPAQATVLAVESW